MVSLPVRCITCMAVLFYLLPRYVLKYGCKCSFNFGYTGHDMGSSPYYGNEKFCFQLIGVLFWFL